MAIISLDLHQGHAKSNLQRWAPALFLRFRAREREAKKRARKREEKRARKKRKRRALFRAFSSTYSGNPVSEPKAARQGGKARVLSEMLNVKLKIN